MKKIVGILQEGMFADKQINLLESGLKEIYKKNYSSKESVAVMWMIMPEGYAYAERKPSKAALIMIEVDEGTDQEIREGLMSLFSKYLLENFEISPLDSVITVANTSFVNGFFEAQRKRVAPLSRPLVTFKILSQTLYSKLSRGYMTLPVRF